MDTSTLSIKERNNHPSTYPRTSRRCGLLLLSLSTLLTSSAVLAQSASDGASAIAEVIDLVDTCMAWEMEERGVPGAALALVVDGELVHERGYGVKHRDQEEAVDADTQFRIASIQKMMTAAAVMTQVQQGRIELDEPVTKLIPELRFRGRPRAKEISIAHLLTHTAAVPDIQVGNCGAEETLSQWVADLADVRLFARPGVFWNYSNAGFDLAGLVAERASGMPYQQLVREQVWEPASMMSTTLSPAETITYGNYAFGHQALHSQTQPSVIYAPDSYDCPWTAPAANGFSTASDLARWAMLMMDGGGTVLTPASVETMQARQVSLDDDRSGPDYGYGIFAERYRGIETRWHSGNLPGWSSLLLWVPQKRFAVAVLSNGGIGTAPSATAYCALNAVLEPEPEEPDNAEDDSTDSATWMRFRGEYLILKDDYNGLPVPHPEETQIDWIPAYIDLVDDQLFLSLFDSDAYELKTFPLQHLDSDSFFIDFNADGVQAACRYEIQAENRGNDLGIRCTPDTEPEITFIDRATAFGKRTRWLRSRHFVGHRL